MSDALSLPPRPKLEGYKKVAKDLQYACKSADRGAIRQWAERSGETIVRLHGIEITPQVRNEIHNEAQRIEQRWHEFKKSNPHAGRCTLAAAHLFLARVHGFASWPKFARHLEEMARENTAVSNFETAVDAIVSGDAAKLKRLLAEDPELVRTRSTREHRSTLLHYVSANGVEDFRQKTPQNIVEITKMLLEAGADVNAESDAYAGRSTTLGLTATSYHPEATGVQLQLMAVLIEHGAIIDGPDSGSGVMGCLHNGRRSAAEFLASRGARLDLEAAAGLGQLDTLQGFFNNDGTLKPPATQQQLKDGFAWACQFGKTNVVEFLLHRGVKVDAKLAYGAETGLHWAGFTGHSDMVKLLLEHRAPIEVKDERHDGTPLEWALYAWGTSLNGTTLERYYEVVALLIREGAKLDLQWFQDDEGRLRTAKKMQSDPRMQIALRGEMLISPYRHS